MKIIDLTHDISPNMPVYPGTRKPQIDSLYAIREVGFNEGFLHISTHTGTHLDSPAHILEKGETIDMIGLERFMGRGRVVDCTKVQGVIEKKYLEKELRGATRPDFLLLYTGWDSLWNTKEYFSGYPVLTTGAAQFICDMALKGIGIDAVSVDHMEDTAYPLHLILLRHKLVIAENLVNLRELLNKDFIFFCFPLKIKGGDGCPVRAVGKIE